jgi:hypothetical protein
MLNGLIKEHQLNIDLYTHSTKKKIKIPDITIAPVAAIKFKISTPPAALNDPHTVPFLLLQPFYYLYTTRKGTPIQ